MYIFFCLTFFIAVFSCKTTEKSTITESEPEITVPISSEPTKPAVKPEKKENLELEFANKLKNLLAKNKLDDALKLFNTYDASVTGTENMQNLKLSILISKNDFETAKNLANELETKYPKNTDTLFAQSLLAAVEIMIQKKLHT